MLDLIRRAALLAAAAFAFGTASAAEAEPMTVYDTALAPGWENWSWAKTELGIELGGSPRRPIRVVAGGWQALYLHHAPFSTTGLKRISFLIQGSVPDRDVRVFALTDGKVVGEGKLVKVGNTGWTDVKIPLVTLGVEDQTIDGFWIQNASEVALPKFYVTEIRLD
ncbi:MAG TPA: hypothetical protein VM146_09930 [Steroidobacteraceae bacterium]|nr:hypothetical protein [Steroidobacteraceae bacterium]